MEQYMASWYMAIYGTDEHFQLFYINCIAVFDQVEQYMAIWYMAIYGYIWHR